MLSDPVITICVEFEEEPDGTVIACVGGAPIAAFRTREEAVERFGERHADDAGRVSPCARSLRHIIDRTL
jgi:hypothetical protein